MIRLTKTWSMFRICKTKVSPNFPWYSITLCYKDYIFLSLLMNKRHLYSFVNVYPLYLYDLFSRENYTELYKVQWSLSLLYVMFVKQRKNNIEVWAAMYSSEGITLNGSVVRYIQIEVKNLYQVNQYLWHLIGHIYDMRQLSRFVKVIISIW